MARQLKPPGPHTVIYATDVKKMMGRGRSMRIAYRILQKIRQHYGKPPKSDVTVEEYCKYMKHEKYEVQHIIDYIRGDEELVYYSNVNYPSSNMLALMKRWEEERLVFLCILILLLLNLFL
jgi:hypothetical protein